ncbi:transposase YhgA family protein, partial [Candidatus Magnetomorum sp. HK-1]
QASFQQQLKEIETNLCELLMQLPQEPGINYVRFFSVYIYATQRREVAVKFFSVLKQHPQMQIEYQQLVAQPSLSLEAH